MAALSEKEFRLEEFRSLRREIELHIEETRKLERLILVGTMAVYAWLSTQQSAQFLGILYSVAWWLPAVFSVFGAIRYYGVMKRIIAISLYIKEIERIFSAKKLQGGSIFYRIFKLNIQ